MRLQQTLSELLAQETSLFRVQLLREDLARLAKLEALVPGSADVDAFRKAGARVGWTQGDARTQELGEALDRLLVLIYERETGAPDGHEALIEEAWHALHRVRMERLVGCLATPTPKPID